MSRIFAVIALVSLACVAMLFAMPSMPLAGADPGAFLTTAGPPGLLPALMLGIVALCALAILVSAVSLATILLHLLRSPRRRMRTGMMPVLQRAASPPAPHMRC